jgi:outer membrane protein OmpA-like peptidoglycan-associated protein
MLRPTLRISPLLILLVLAGCKVQASASASLTADDGLELDASASASPDGDASAAIVRVTIRKQGDELVQEGGQINFAYDAAELEGDQTFATLQAYADLLETYPEITLRIEGHTDSRGSDSRNRALSQRRAEAVRDWLIAHGIDGERLEAKGLGEDQPETAEPPECHDKKADDAAPWCDETIWSANRRSEFHIVKGGETLAEGEVRATPSPAAADVVPPVGKPGFGPGVYLYGSPGLFSATIANRDESLSRRLSYRWGVGVGYLWRRERFAAALGLGVSHTPVRIDPGSPRCALIECVSANDLLLDVELRIGGGSPRLLGYVLFAPGLALGISRVDNLRYTTPGFGLDFGAGLWGLVWRGLFLGGEALVTPGIYADRAPSFHSSTSSVGLALRVLMGWQFGWRPRR